MIKVKITAMRQTCYPDLSERYENPLENPCEVKAGDVFVSRHGEKPDGFCDSAWDSLKPFVETLSKGGGNFFGGWMKNEKTAMVSCNDGFRPMSFLLEALDED